MSESHQNPAPLGPAAPRMTALVGNAEYAYANYPGSELNMEQQVTTRNWGDFLLSSSQSILLAISLQCCVYSRMIASTPA